jgi:hypothetical protein
MAEHHKPKSVGHCLCGSIRYETIGAPLWVAHCHCAQCRKNTGSAVATFIGYKSEQVIFTDGLRTIFESSPGVKRGFCQKCGTPISYEGDRCEGEIHMYLSTIDNPDAFPAQVHVFHREKISWFEIADDLPRYETTGSDKKTD